jgi:outer membrane protein assembly factor BamB
MKRNRLMIAFASSLLVAQIATAQMMGGGSGGNRHGSSPSTGSGGMNGSGSMNGFGMNGGMEDGFGAMGQALTVGTDGVVYTQRVTTVASQTPSLEVTAIRPTGTVAWTAKLDGGMGRLELSGNLVLVASGDGDMEMNGGTQAADDESQLIALSAASGSVQWKLDIDGFVTALEPFSGGTYVLIAKHDATNAGTGMHDGANGTASMKRTVAAIDNTGKVLWSLDLN